MRKESSFLVKLQAYNEACNFTLNKEVFHYSGYILLGH